jgi:NADH:ubiquinone oxidoreductase subunit 6 (subunit J)
MMDARIPERAFYAVLAVLCLALLGVGLRAAGAVGLAFGLFSVMTLGGALVCVWERSVVRSAFALMPTFTGVAGLFLLLEADFLAMAQVLVYIGGILALLLFGVMLSPPDPGERRLNRVLPGLAAVGLGVGWVSLGVARTVRWAARGAPPDGKVGDAPPTAESIGVAFLRPDGYVVAFELAAVLLTVALVAAVYIARRRAADFTPSVAESGGEAG